MANHQYIISEVRFFEDKNSTSTRQFLEGSGIDLDQPCCSKMPTLLEIEAACNAIGMKIQTRSDGHNHYEIISQDEKTSLHLVFDDVLSKEEDAIGMFEIEKGSDYKSVIALMKQLGKTHGQFLLYCDSGAMALITQDKSYEQIIKEFC